MLEQFELVADEAPAMGREIEAAERTDTGKPGMARWSDFLTATYVRAARRAASNPAEMEYVGDRMKQVAAYLAGRRSQASGGQLGAALRGQVEAMRGQAGVTQQQIDDMLRAAEQAEGQTVQPAPSRVQQNLEVLRAARGNVSEAMWIRIAGVSGGVGLMALGDMADTTSAGVLAQLDELREIYTAAQENRAYPGEGGAPAP